jgi:hypothetical protein
VTWRRDTPEARARPSASPAGLAGRLRSARPGRRPAPSAGAVEPPTARSVLAGPLVALVTLLAALIATQAAGVPLRDPDNVAAKYLALVGFSVWVMVGLDVAIRAGRRTGTWRPSREAMRDVRRERWSPYRGLAVASAIVSFYVSYLAYRNIKSMIPLLRPGELFDRQLAELDRAMFGGNDPAALLHSLLGIGVQTHVLSAIYVFFIVLLPLSLALALVFSPNLPGGLFYATALSINWPLGAATYLMLPALGPVYATPGLFAELPASAVTGLQAILLDQRLEFLRDPAVAGTAQAIAAFASLHVSMIFTAAVAAHLLGLHRRLRIGLWVLLAVSAMATVYLGWHYVIDDVAGVVIALAALALARVLTGVDLRTARHAWRQPAPESSY